jgi:hypothetical protein
MSRFFAGSSSEDESEDNSEESSPEIETNEPVRAPGKFLKVLLHSFCNLPFHILNKTFAEISSILCSSIAMSTLTHTEH